MTVIRMAGAESGKISIAAKERLEGARHEHSRRLRSGREKHTGQRDEAAITGLKLKFPL